MKRVLALCAAVLLPSTIGCSEPKVVAEAAIGQEGTAESLALSDLPIRLLPYDRDAIFDSLTAAAATPEPGIPVELQQQRDAVQAAHAVYEQAELRWGAMRDSLRAISERTQSLEQQDLRATPQYAQAFAEFNRLDTGEDRVKQQMDQAFQQFTQLQGATIGRADSLRVARETWAEEAYRDFERVVAAKLDQVGLEERADTTNAAGVAIFSVPEGRWWVYSRYTLPNEELYWNIPLEVTGDSTHIELTGENAESRPVL